MASSDNTGFIAFSTAMLGSEYPISAALYHDTMDTARHAFDARAQVLVNYPPRDASRYLVAGGTDTSTWYQIATFAFHLSMRGDGQSFRVRVRLAAAASAANSITFRAVLSSRENASLYANGAVADNILEASTSSTTPVFLTPDVIYLSADQARECMRDQPTYDAVSSGTPVSVLVADATLSIWSKTSNAAATARLFGVHAAEYIGA